MRMSTTEVGLYDYDIMHIKGIYIYVVVLMKVCMKAHKEKKGLYENVSEFWVFCT